MKSKLASLGAAFDRLSSREQSLVLLIASLAFGMIVGLSGFLVSRDLQKKEQRIAAKMEKLQALAALKVDYQRRLGEQNQLAGEIKQNNDMRLLSYIEEVSKQSNIQLRNAAERSGATGSEILKEVGAEVSIENVSIDRLHDFLKRIEEGNRLVKVRKLDIEARFDNPKMLNAKVTVGTFKTSES